MGIFFFFQKNKITQEDSPTKNIQKIEIPTEKEKETALISNDLQNFLSTPTSEEITWFSPKNTEKNEILPIREFFQKNSLRLSVEMQTKIDWKDYDLFLCPSPDENGVGVRLTQIANPQTGKPTYEEILQALDTWSSVIPIDLWLLFFKNPEETKNIQSVFVENKEYSYDSAYEWRYKKAIVTFVSGEKKEFYYGTVAHNILITQSLSCVHKVSKQLYDLVP